MSLTKLIEAVEAGAASMNDFAAVFPSETAYGPTTCGEAHKAYNGSLDAAKRLHDALLPGWTVDNMGQRAGGWLVQLGRFDGKTPRPAPEAIIRDNPARAWLLAILRALEEEGRDG